MMPGSNGCGVPVPINLPSLLDGPLWWIWVLAIYLGVILIWAVAGLWRALSADAKEWLQ